MAVNPTVRYLSTLQSPDQGSNLPTVLRHLTGQGSTMNPQSNISQAASQAYNAAGGNDPNKSGSSPLGDWLKSFGGQDGAQSGLNNANAMFGAYDPASAGLGSANDIFGTFGGLGAGADAGAGAAGLGAADAGAGLGLADAGGGAGLGLAALFA